MRMTDPLPAEPIPAEQLLHLLTWLSPAFPTGGFAWSHGLEFAVEAGDIADALSLTDWLDNVLRFGTGRNDAILLRHALRADKEDPASIAEFAAACAPTREIAAETLGQGSAFAAAALPWMAEHRLPSSIAYPVAVGALAAAYGIDEDAVVTAYLHSFIANLVSAGVRLIPLAKTRD